jgi:hypothetical protein
MKIGFANANACGDNYDYTCGAGKDLQHSRRHKSSSCMYYMAQLGACQVYNIGHMGIHVDYCRL